MIVIIGESASGKSSAERELVDIYGYKKIVSYTTRQPRSGEVDGVDYYFITDEHFNKLKKEDFFAEIGCYNGWQYGIAIEDCTNDKVAVVTPHGLRQIKSIKGLNVVSFYIDVPRRDRLIQILQRGDDIEESYRRNLSDLGMFDGVKDEVDYVITNKGYVKTPKDTADEIVKILNNKVGDKNKA